MGVNEELFKTFIDAVVELGNRYALLEQIALNAKRVAEEQSTYLRDTLRQIVTDYGQVVRENHESEREQIARLEHRLEELEQQVASVFKRIDKYDARRSEDLHEVWNLFVKRMVNAPEPQLRTLAETLLAHVRAMEEDRLADARKSMLASMESFAKSLPAPQA